MTSSEAANLNYGDQLLVLRTTTHTVVGSLVVFVSHDIAKMIKVYDPNSARTFPIGADDVTHYQNYIRPAGINSPIAEEVLLELVKEGFETPAKASGPFLKPEDCYWHKWQKYTGFTEVYEFCTDCGTKLFAKSG